MEIIEQNIAHSYYWNIPKKELHLFCTQMTKQRIILRPKSRITEYFFHNQEEIYTQIWGQTISLEKETTENKNSS